MPDLYLGIETSGTGTGVALARAGNVIYEQALGDKMRHDELLMPLIDEALASINARPQGLAGLGVTIGPGMFTSLRVGLSTAKGFAFVLGIPVKGINTLWALARSVPEPGRPVLATIDARKSQVYAALYHQDRVLIEPGLFSYSEIAEAASGRSGHKLIIAGSGSGLCRPFLESRQVQLETSGIENPLPRVIALAAAQAIQAGQADDLERLEPLYLRRTDAELARERRTNS